MSPSRSIVTGALLAMLIGPAPLNAGIETGTVGTRIGLTALDFDYEEFDHRGLSLDREKARLPGAVAGILYQPGRWLIGGAVRWLSGVADYTSPRIDSRTDEAILDLELLAGTRLLASQNQHLSLVAGIGYRKWWRDIRSAGAANGLEETYRWGYCLLGVREEYTFNSRTRLVAELYGTRSVQPTLEARFLNSYDQVELDLGAKNGLRLRFLLERDLRPGTSLWVSPWYESWELGRSADNILYSQGVPVGTLFEPRSDTVSYGIDIGLSWQFVL